MINGSIHRIGHKRAIEATTLKNDFKQTIFSLDMFVHVVYEMMIVMLNCTVATSYFRFYKISTYKYAINLWNAPYKLHLTVNVVTSMFSKFQN